MSTTARQQYRELVVAALRSVAGLTVKSPGSWDAQASDFPEAKVRTPGDRKSSLNKQMPQFTTTVQVQIALAVEADKDDAAQDALDVLCFQVERVVLGSPDIIKITQQVASVSTQTRVDTDGKKAVGSALMSIEFETFEVFDPVELDTTPTTSVREIRVEVPIDPAVVPVFASINFPN